jgi:hypothetical protein
VSIESEYETDAEKFAKWLVTTSPKKFRLQGDGKSSRLGKASVNWRPNVELWKTPLETKPVNVYVSRETTKNLSAREKLRRQLVSRIELDFLKGVVGSHVQDRE